MVVDHVPRQPRQFAPTPNLDGDRPVTKPVLTGDILIVQEDGAAVIVAVMIFGVGQMGLVEVI